MDKIKGILEKFGQIFRKQLIEEWLPNETYWVTGKDIRAIKEEDVKQYINGLKNNWFYALNFFLSRVFFKGGRGDVLSGRYLEYTREILSSYKEKNFQGIKEAQYSLPSLEKVKKKEDLKKINWENCEIGEELFKYGVTNPADIKCVLGTFGFVKDKCEKYDYSIVGLVADKEKVQDAYNIFFTNSKSKIFDTGPKTISFFLRDLYTVTQLFPTLTWSLKWAKNKDEISNSRYIQPIDGWVRKLGWKLYGKELKDEEIQKKIGNEKLNQGMWLVASTYDECKWRRWNIEKDEVKTLKQFLREVNEEDI